MAAECYHCNLGIQPALSGAQIIPLGVCRRCHVHCCAAHALRDSRVPEWICCLCDTKLLATSAALAGRSVPAPSLWPDGINLDFTSRRFRVRTFREYLRSRESLQEAHPTFEMDVKSLVDSFQYGESGNGTPIWNELTSEGKLLFAAAITLALILETDLSQFDSSIANVLSQLRIQE